MPKGTWREFEDFPEKGNENCQIKFDDIASRPVRVHKTRGGKGGKTVTIISGLDLNTLDAKNLLKKSEKNN